MPTKAGLLNSVLPPLNCRCYCARSMPQFILGLKAEDNESHAFFSTRENNYREHPFSTFLQIEGLRFKTKQNKTKPVANSPKHVP